MIITKKELKGINFKGGNADFLNNIDNDKIEVKEGNKALHAGGWFIRFLTDNEFEIVKSNMEESYEQARADFPPNADADFLTRDTIDKLLGAVKVELDILKDSDGIYRDMDGRKKRGVRNKLEKFIEKYDDYYDSSH